MATTIQGEIRIGPNHQARVPPLINGQCEEQTRETLIWRPDKLADTDLLMYLRAARSMAAFAGMCDGGSSEDGFLAASRDQTTSTAMDALHQNGYDTGRALHDLVKKPIGHTIEKTWTEDDIKKFVRGLKQHGKNFFRIRRDLLSHKETCDLVEFYYLWKKSPAAVTHRPRQRPRRGQMLRRGKAGAGKTARATPSENSSTSDSDSGCEDSDDNSNLSGPCRHCEASVAKEWHRVDKEGTVLCTDCKLHFDEARNDVIRANDPEHMAIENKPPVVVVAAAAVESTSSEQAPPPAKRARTEASSSSSSTLSTPSTSSSLAPPPPPPLIPALLNASTIDASSSIITINNTKSAVAPASSSDQSSGVNLRSPTGQVEIKQEIKSVSSKSKSDDDHQHHQQSENHHVEGSSSATSSTAQDEFVNMLGTNKGMDPKLDDTECHRSANAIFRRHWNRGDNSCARTDLIYVPIPRLQSAGGVVVRSHHDSGSTTMNKDKSPIRPSANSSGMVDARRVSSAAPGASGGAQGPAALDSSMPALQRLRDYASAASFGGAGLGEGAGGGAVMGASAGVMDPRFKMEPGVAHSRASPAVNQQPPPLQYTMGGPPGGGAMMQQRGPMQGVPPGGGGGPGGMPPYELLAAAAAAGAGPQHFADMAMAERWFAAEHNRMQWERAAAMNPAAANDMAVRLQLERMMAGGMQLTHTHAHTHLHIHAAQQARAAAAMHQNPGMMGGFSPANAAWAAAAAAASRPGTAAGALEAFQAANMLYGGGPQGPPSYPPPPGFSLGQQQHMMDTINAERMAQQQHLMELIHQQQRQMMPPDRD